MNIRIDLRYIKKYCVEITLIYIFYSTAINYCLRAWQFRIWNNNMIPNSLYINIVTLLLFIICVSPRMLKNFKIDIIVLLFVLMCLCTYSFLLNGDESLFFNNTLIWLIGNGFLSYAVARYVEDWDLFLRIYSSTSKYMLLFIFLCWYFTKDFIRYRSSPDWYMFFASALLVPILGVFILFDRKKKKIDLLIFTLGMVLTIAYGSRGSLVQIGFFLFLYFILNGKYFEGFYKLIFVLIVGYVSFRYIFTFYDVSSSRTLSMIFNNSLGETDRLIAWKRMLNFFFSQSNFKQLFGLGLAGERLFIYRNIYKVGYPHNLFLEWLLQYGYIGCSIIIVLMVVFFIKVMLAVFRNEIFATLFSVFAAYFIVLLFSSSYLISNNFFLVVSFGVTVLENDKNKRIIV